MNPQKRALRETRVHVAGTGRIGSEIILALEAAGVGFISANDPQRCETEQLSHWNFARRSDLGRPKVHVIARYLDGRPNLVFEPVVAPNQSREVEPYLERAHLIVSCANRLDARLYLERADVRLKKPSIQVCAQDGRTALGGMISIWMPEVNRACFGCLFPSRQHVVSGEVLVPSVTRTLANLAAHLAVTILTRKPRDPIPTPNLLVLDLAAPRIEHFQVLARSGCSTCRINRPGRAELCS